MSTDSKHRIIGGNSSVAFKNGRVLNSKYGRNIRKYRRKPGQPTTMLLLPLASNNNNCNNSDRSNIQLITVANPNFQVQFVIVLVPFSHPPYGNNIDESTLLFCHHNNTFLLPSVNVTPFSIEHEEAKSNYILQRITLQYLPSDNASRDDDDDDDDDDGVDNVDNDASWRELEVLELDGKEPKIISLPSNNRSAKARFCVWFHFVGKESELCSVVSSPFTIGSFDTFKRNMEKKEFREWAIITYPPNMHPIILNANKDILLFIQQLKFSRINNNSNSNNNNNSNNTNNNNNSNISSNNNGNNSTNNNGNHNNSFRKVDFPPDFVFQALALIETCSDIEKLRQVWNIIFEYIIPYYERMTRMKCRNRCAFPDGKSESGSEIEMMRLKIRPMMSFIARQFLMFMEHEKREVTKVMVEVLEILLPKKTSSAGKRSRDEDESHNNNNSNNNNNNNNNNDDSCELDMARFVMEVEMWMYLIQLDFRDSESIFKEILLGMKVAVGMRNMQLFRILNEMMELRLGIVDALTLPGNKEENARRLELSGLMDRLREAVMNYCKAFVTENGEYLDAMNELRGQLLGSPMKKEIADEIVGFVEMKRQRGLSMKERYNDSEDIESYCEYALSMLERCMKEQYELGETEE